MCFDTKSGCSHNREGRRWQRNGIGKDGRLGLLGNEMHLCYWAKQGRQTERWAVQTTCLSGFVSSNPLFTALTPILCHTSKIRRLLCPRASASSPREDVRGTLWFRDRYQEWRYASKHRMAFSRSKAQKPEEKKGPSQMMGAAEGQELREITRRRWIKNTTHLKKYANYLV